MNLLIITPMREELNLLLKACTRRGFHAQRAQAGRLPIVQLPELGITLARGGVGKAQFALQTQHLLDSSAGWDVVVCAGAAGALAEGLAIGDVVVATATLEHDYNDKFTWHPRPGFRSDPAAIADLRRVAASLTGFQVHFGRVASGDEDVVDRSRKRALHQATGALAVAWEGAGGARACAFSGVPFVELRAVTDSADRRAPLDFVRHLKAAMENLAALIIAWASQV